MCISVWSLYYTSMVSYLYRYGLLSVPVWFLAYTSQYILISIPVYFRVYSGIVSSLRPIP